MRNWGTTESLGAEITLSDGCHDSKQGRARPKTKAKAVQIIQLKPDKASLHVRRCTSTLHVRAG